MTVSVPAVSTNYADLLDPLWQEIGYNQFDQEPDMIPTLYDQVGTNGRETLKYSEVGAFDDFSAFTGTVAYDGLAQGYDVTTTPLQFASGFQVERKLFDDDQWGIMNERPAGLGEAAQRTRQRHAARVFNNAFSVDSMFYTHSEGVALCSDSHTTTSGASTSTGFDNLVTSALSATAVTAAKIQFMKFRGDRAEVINSMPNELWYPIDLFDVAEEIIRSTGKPDTANNNMNVHQGQYTPYQWIYMTDTNNWFMANSGQRKKFLKWTDRVPLEFAFAEDLDTIVAKFRAYMRYGALWRNWRFVIGAQVS